jgi:hypothetical protein
MRSWLIVVALLLPWALAAQQIAPGVRLGGEIRLRGEWDGRTADAGDDAAVLSRVRLGVTATLTPWLSTFLQLQDARAWGTETNTLTDASADRLDLHQGYVDLGVHGVTTRLGRQELPLGDERLVSAVGWTNTGRSFDGLSTGGTWGGGGNEVRLFWMNVAERDSLQATGTNPQVNEGLNNDGWFFGAFYARRLGASTLELTFVGDRKALVAREIYTADARVVGALGRLIYEAAGAYQFGPDIRAWFASGKLGTAIGRGSVAAQLDWLSGDADPTDSTTRAFHTLYATNHKFYGYMDYVLAFPTQTQQAGLVDAMARLALPLPRQLRLRADGHYFATAKERNGLRYIGVEGDVVVERPLVRGAVLEVGGSVFAPADLAGQLLPAFAASTDELTYWGYVQLTVRIP